MRLDAQVANALNQAAIYARRAPEDGVALCALFAGQRLGEAFAAQRRMQPGAQRERALELCAAMELALLFALGDVEFALRDRER